MFQQLPQISKKFQHLSNHFPKDGGFWGLFEDQSGKMSMEEFNWAYATLQQEVEEPWPRWFEMVEVGGK